MERARKRPAKPPTVARRRLRTRVLVADDHPIVLQGVRLLLESQGLDVVAVAPDGREAVRLAQELRPDVVVLDVVMPVLDGLSAARAIMQRLPEAGLILLTGMPPEPPVSDALRAGARGLVLKSEVAEDLVEAVRDVARGAMYVSPAYSRTSRHGSRNNGTPSHDSLSPRELELLRLIAQGLTTKQAAAELGISVKTAESYRESIAEKLQVHGTAGLVRYAIRAGLIGA